jgi:hypothetical protein
MGSSGALFYAECTAGCATQSPTFSALAVPLGAALSAVHVSAAVRTGGGIVAAVTANNQGSLNYGLYFAECASSCTNPADWIVTKVDDNVDDVRPGVAMLGPVRAVGYATHDNTNYAECTSTCDSATSWLLAKADGARVQANVRVALHDAGTQLVRLVANDQDRVASCTGSCVTGAIGWTSTSTTIGVAPNGLSYSASPTQRVAGMSGGGTIRYSECASFPCAGQWSVAPFMSGVALTTSQLDLGVTPQGGTSLVFTDLTGLMQQATLTAGLWTTSPIMACGQMLGGQQPSQRFDSNGGLSVLYSTTTSVRFHAP